MIKAGEEQRSFESYLSLDETKPIANKLEIKLVRSWPPNKEFLATLSEEHEVYVKYQTRIHNDSHLECDKSQFQRFLCTSPLLMKSHNGPLLNRPCLTKLDTKLVGDLDEQFGYGSFHQQYRINGKLIAVGVIDILNGCASSVYFFYDPDYQFLKLGTYSALRLVCARNFF